jgi:hypothetical protein
MAYFLPGFQFRNAGMKLTKLPFLGLNVGSNGFGGKKGLRAPGALDERVQALLFPN